MQKKKVWTVRIDAEDLALIRRLKIKPAEAVRALFKRLIKGAQK
jgi:hypothetical protein